MTVLALEIGDGRFAACRVAPDVGTDQVRRISYPARAAWDSCRDLLMEVSAGGNVDAVGIACTGPIDMAAGVVAPTEIPEWRAGFAIVEAVRKVFPAATVPLALDGACLAVAEQNFGATQGVMDTVTISVSDRISGGLTVGGFTVVGRTGNAGSIGHTLVPGYDERCECGGRGCLEAVAGGGAAVRWASTQGWRGSSVAELARDAQGGNDIAVAAVGRAGTALGRAIASAAALLDVDLVVVGGTMAAAGRALWKPLGEAVTAHAKQAYLPALRVVPSTLGEVGVLAGAGVLAATVAGD
ncbi:ROK family protein [Nocardia tengchongensis]|uniref:ROK family protein n=1 Tax=Nocardia tengchongensis TaxID=2055889 RepID=UPI003616A418